MSEISTAQLGLAEAVARHLGGKSLLNYFTHIHEETGFIYFATPAVANIRTIGSLNMAVAETMGVDYTLAGLGQIFNRQANIVGNPNFVGFDVFSQMIEDPDVVRFTFLRNPADRFSAIYRNLFSINTMESQPRQKVFEFLGIPLEENLTMLDLAELLAEEDGLKALLPQLRSQRQMTAYDLVDYSFIGRHETWEKDFATIAHEIFGRDVARFDPIKTFNKDPEGAALKSLVDADTIEALKLAYAEDYDMLDEVAALFPNGFLQE